MERDQALKFMYDLLRLMVTKRGSDLFVTAGFPPAIKVDGRIVPQRLCVTCLHFRPNAHPGDPAGPHHCAYVDAALSETDLRIDCPEHSEASPEATSAAWTSFLRVAQGGKL